jgi:hypothetical protein
VKRALFNAWISALRSGNWRQGRYQLESRDGHFCCLGVLIRNDRWSKFERRAHPASGIMFRDREGVQFYAHPSLDYQQQAGIDNDLVCRLIDMNDLHEKTFVEIADYLESIKETFVDEEKVA